MTHTSLLKGIEQVKVGNRISDISRAIQSYAEEKAFSVVRQFVGHGIGAEDCMNPLKFPIMCSGKLHHV